MTLTILGITWYEFENQLTIWGPLLLMAILVYLVCGR